MYKYVAIFLQTPAAEKLLPGTWLTLSGEMLCHINRIHLGDKFPAVRTKLLLLPRFAEAGSSPIVVNFAYCRGSSPL